MYTMGCCGIREALPLQKMKAKPHAVVQKALKNATGNGPSLPSLP
ncbi:hypothetical protein CK203_071279 [Vitis vinifera]|uniref:Uncharacterized protein n=1 Tax=Vitis vinifera TaxID=29760 RepID=A0A438ET48_VITVI|nr:hypothetical protein CK203_071279 [Vitis vinifera]